MLRSTLLLALPLLAAGAGWSYDRCDAVNGPSGWGGYCSDGENSPIDVCGAVPYSLPTLVGTDWCTVRHLNIKNNGHTIQIGILESPPTLTAGLLSSIVGRGSATTPPIWQLEQAHMHWGRPGQNTEGSEHWLNGKQYPLEIHFVHFNKARGVNVGSAVGSLAPDALLVVGVFFDLDSPYPSEPAAITSIANAVGAASEYLNNDIPMNDTVQLSTIFDGTGTFSTYAGGLTTPTCNEQVTWVVMETPKKITQRTLEKIKAAAIPHKVYTGSGNADPYAPVPHSRAFEIQGGTPAAAPAPTASTGDVEAPVVAATGSHLISHFGNYRPLVPKGKRTVWTSSASGTPCGAAAEALHGCPSSMGCMTVTNVPCIFPFRYKSRVYTTCTTVDNKEMPWCPTSVDVQGNYVDKKWADCERRLCTWDVEPSKWNSSTTSGSSRIVIPAGPSTSDATPAYQPSLLATIATSCLLLLASW